MLALVKQYTVTTIPGKTQSLKSFILGKPQSTPAQTPRSGKMASRGSLGGGGGQEVGSVDKMQEVRISSRCMGTNGFS